VRVPEILFPEYRAYVASRVEVNNAMMALLAGSRLAAHTMSLTVGSTATLAQVFPAVEHIGRFDLRSDSARQLLNDADQHIASVAAPYALATHEEFVMDMLELLKNEGRTLITHGKPIRAWNMHKVLFETCGYSEPTEWMETFHVLREMRNCIIHAGGGISQNLTDRIAEMGPAARTGWKKMHLSREPEALDDSGHLALTAESVFTAFAVTKRLGREVNAALGEELDASTWARLAIEDYRAKTSKTRNSSAWRRSAIGYARQFYSEASLDNADLEKAARNLGLWTAARWD
jgi:hypothetical protein